MSLVPIVTYIASTGGAERENDSDWFRAIFFGVHSMFINPVVTIGSFSSLFIQIPTAAALDIWGMASQAVVFAAVAVSWVYRVEFPTVDGQWTLHLLNTWYQLVGWAAVDNAVYAIVQFILFCVVRRRLWKHEGHSNLEEELLLTR